MSTSSAIICVKGRGDYKRVSCSRGWALELNWGPFPSLWPAPTAASAPVAQGTAWEGRERKGPGVNPLATAPQQTKGASHRSPPISKATVARPKAAGMSIPTMGGCTCRKPLSGPFSHAQDSLIKWKSPSSNLLISRDPASFIRQSLLAPIVGIIIIGGH